MKAKSLRIVILVEFILIVGLFLLANYKAEREGLLLMENDQLRIELSKCKSGIKTD